MKIHVLYSNKKYLAHIRYVFERISDFLGMEGVCLVSYDEISQEAHAPLVVSYGSEPPAGFTPHIHIKEESSFWQNYLTEKSLPIPPFASWQNLPILFGKKDRQSQWVEKKGNRIVSCIDIIAGTFFLLSRCEELVIRERDVYKRFPARCSVLAKAHLLERPVADEYVDLFCSWVGEIVPSFRKKNLPDISSFVLYITHDVDSPFKFTWKNVLGLKQPFARGLRCLLGKEKDPFWTFSDLLSLEKKHGIIAEYFFLAGGTHPLDRGYSLNQLIIKELVNKLRRSRCPIGIHFSLSSHLDLFEAQDLKIAEKGFSRELGCFREILNFSPTGSRQHYLGLSIPETWRILSNLGISFDTSAGFAESPGFRCGTCRAFPCFDAQKGEPLPLLEIPLIAMDAGFIHYLKLTPQEALLKMNELVDTVIRHNGIFTLLWHNNTMSEEDFPGWGGIYQAFLEECKKKKPLLVHPAEYFRRD